MSDLISRCELFNKLATVPASPEANALKGEVYSIIQSMPTAGVPNEDIVRCKDCKWCKEQTFPNGSQLECHCDYKEYELDDPYCPAYWIVNVNDYCSYGERKEGAE